MTYQELMDAGKAVFNFHPDTQFENVEQILTLGCKRIMTHRTSLEYIAAFAKDLALYADSNKKEESEE